MNLKEIQGIIKDFESSQLTLLELELDNFKIKLSKQAISNAPNAPTAVATPVLEQGPKVPTANPACIPIKSPLVGTFYVSTNPTGEPFVKVGQFVKKGDPVCIIEAMKIMNEITAPVAGIIERIDVKNGQVVGYDQVLITLHTGEIHAE